MSQNPRTTSGITTNDGRTTILATVIGEESFVDVNGNGVFDTGDTFTDLAEAFRNDDEDDPEVRDSTEPFIDFNNSGIFDSADDTNTPNDADGLPDGDTLFNGVQCTTSCSTTKTISVRDSLVLVMAEDTASIISILDQAAAAVGSSINLIDTTSLTYKIVGTSNQQILPVGTKVDFAVTNGTISAGASYVVGNTNINATDAGNTAGEYSVFLKADTTPSNDGVIKVTVTFPNGDVANGPPISIDDRGRLAINAPATNLSITAGTSTTFTATATDPQDGDISGAVTWSSSVAIDGALGSGSSLAYTLSPGLHTITATSTDADANETTASITRTVTGVAISAPATGVTLATSTPTLTATAFHATNGDLSSSIVWTEPTDGTLGTGASITSTALTTGTRTITATDSSGATAVITVIAP